MRKSEIVRMAYDAGCKSIIVPEEWFRFANLVAAAEREKCAKICEDDDWKVAATLVRERGAP